MKRLISLILALSMILAFIPSAFAADRDFSREESLATRLKALGLFKGVSETDFALNRAPTRVEALVMLIRLLGKEEAAMNTTETHPFTDVPAWADKYVAYAYGEKLTNGISETKFGSGNVASAEMYLTFVLRALGYSDAAGGDFVWSSPYKLANEAGLLKGSPDCDSFLRGDVVLISYAALGSKIKGSDKTLGNALIDAGAFTTEAFNQNYDISHIGGGLTLKDELVIGGEDSTFKAFAKYITENDSKSLPLPSVFLPNTEKKETYAVMYDDNEKVFFSTYFLDIENAQHGVTVVYNEAEDALKIIYFLTDAATAAPLMHADVFLKKSDITGEIKITPDSIEVYTETTQTKAEISEKISPVITSGTLIALAYTEFSIDDALGEDKGIADFGFVNLRFE